MTSSLRVDFRDQLEEVSAGFGVADLIASTWKGVEKVKLIIVTNADFRARADATNVRELDGKPVTLSVWDLKRLKQYMNRDKPEPVSLSISRGISGVAFQSLQHPVATTPLRAISQ